MNGEVDEMRSDEIIAIILELREKGWTDTEIIEFIIKIESKNNVTK
ncbi:MAG: hypothetical protein ACI4FV_08230 [Lachnospiraceae bacterium]